MGDTGLCVLTAQAYLIHDTISPSPALAWAHFRPFW